MHLIDLPFVQVRDTIDLSVGSPPSPPDPDTLYSVQDAAPFTSSPVVEVFEHNVKAIHRGIARRQESAVARLLLTARQKARSALPPPSPPAVDSTHVETAPTIHAPVVTPIPPRPPYELRTCSQLNAVLHRRDFHMRVNNQPDSAQLESPPCIQRSCPFCRGPLLLQRFSLLQRLYQLNVLLYGHTWTTDELQSA